MAKKPPKETALIEALHKRFFQQCPDEAARALARWPAEEILRLLVEKPFGAVAEIVVRLDLDTAADVVARGDEDFFRELFTRIDPSHGAVLLARIDESLLAERLALLPAALARELRDLMSYPPDTAGALMDPRVAVFRVDQTVQDALKRVRSMRNRRITDVCLADDTGVLVDVVPLQKVAVSEPDVRLGDLGVGRFAAVQGMAPREEVVQILDERRLASLPVVDLEGRLLGIIRYDTLVAAARQDAAEDVQVMFGAGRDERALSRASFAIRKRLPWLQVNLATAFLAAAVVALFEDTIAKITALAVFLPVVAGQSGNTGSQALAVTMRGLALREIRARHWFRVASKEMSVGFFNGVAVAFTTSLIAYIWMGSIGLSAVIGCAMIVSMVIAGMSGAVIPIVLKSAGQDPAQSSSILLTTVTDIIGFLSFLGLATLFSGMLTVA